RLNRSGKRPITDEQRKLIQEAVDAAERTSIAGLRVLNEIWDQSGGIRKKRKRRKAAWKANPQVVKWFGSRYASVYQIRVTRRRMRAIRNEFKGAVRFAIVQHSHGFRSFRCKRNAAAFCSPWLRIKICPGWYGQTAPFRAGSLIHELSHKKGHIHQMGAKNPELSVALAKKHPRLARRNPASFQGFCMEYY
ncbi:MAG: hypothetical protein ABFR50_10825, partial [Candidatus Fermentibacteria bacterium]